MSLLNYLINTFPEHVEHFLIELINNGANVNAVDCLSEYEYNPLETALRLSREKIVRDYIFSEEDARKIARVRLHKPQIVELLLMHGANPNCKTSGGETPLHIAVAYRSPELVDLLLIYRADPQQRDTKGDTPYDIAKRRNYDEI